MASKYREVWIVEVRQRHIKDDGWGKWCATGIEWHSTRASARKAFQSSDHLQYRAVKYVPKSGG